MRFKGLDLNLLSVLDVLLAERNVSRTGERLHLSQSATSGALTRLREYFRDELLVMAGRQLVPTPRALELAPAIRAILLQIESRILAEAAFDPANTVRNIRIMASDYVTIVCLADALARIAVLAPGLSFEITPPDSSPASNIDGGLVDFLIMPEVYISRVMPSAELFRDSFVCVTSEENTVEQDEFTLAKYLSMRHITVLFSANRQPSFEDWFLDRFGKARHVDVIASSYSLLPFLLQNTCRVATMHRRLAQRTAASHGLRMLAPPLEIPEIIEKIQWHGMNSNDSCLMWVKDQIIASMDGGTPAAE